MRHPLQIALIGFAVLLVVLPSHAQHRVALVIGNNIYSDVPPPTAPGPGSGPLAGNPTLQLSQNKPAPPAPPADLLVQDVPLPGNVSVSYPQNVSENFKRFSGAWVGAWGGQLHHILIVESIRADGTANVVYAIGDNDVVRRHWRRSDATIVGNTLRTGSVTYELTGNGQLDATFEPSNGRSRATMSRIELADLTRPGATISQWPADLLVQDVPLPGNVSVSYPQNVSENFKRFSGAWVGAWGGQLHHILIVESIMADGTANVVYAVGDNARRQWRRHEATIVGNALRVEGLATYELTGNGQLDATFEPSNGRSRATMSRIELADLTRPGATISQWPADLLVQDVPLPGNVSVSYPQNVSENFKRFSGAWVGAWDGQLHHILIVESIMADGTANIVYALGDNDVVRRQWRRAGATIVGNTLRASRVTYELTGNGQLDSTLEYSSWRSRATMSTIELADLLRPGATIWQNNPTPPAPAPALSPWPLVPRAQQPAMPVVGFLSLRSPTPNAVELVAFRGGLAAAGFADGRNVAIEYRWANNVQQLLAPLAAELVQRQVAVIVALDSTPTIVAAKNATSTIPIVFSQAGDPIRSGLVGSLNRPSGNMTGVTSLSTELTGKRLDLLREMAPLATTIAYLTDPRVLGSAATTKDMREAAHVLGQQALILEARNGFDIDAAFATLVKSGAGALVVAPHLLFSRNTNKIVELAARHNIPAIYPHRFFADAGGLMSYDADLTALWHLIGSLYVAQILKGAKPADLPVQQPTKFELVINLKTAKALGLTVPRGLFALADEVIE
jgi:putative tryptophan/tyrosine transport system substrate-binding protein